MHCNIPKRSITEYMYYIIYVHIKNFMREDQRQERCYIVHIAPQGVNSAHRSFTGKNFRRG